MKSNLSPALLPPKERKCTYTLNNTIFTVIDKSPPGYQVDDVYYENYENWLKLPRGFCQVYVNGECIHTLSGLRKYGDETETFGVGLKFNSFTHSYATTKENGECFHTSAFQYNEFSYILLGSKNVHILLDIHQPIHEQLMKISIEQKERVRYAVEMAQKFMDSYFTHEIFTYLSSTKYTFVGESIDPQKSHIVAYNERQIRFFAITSYDPYSTLYSPLTFQSTMDTFSKLNLPIIQSINKCSTDELEGEKKKAFEARNCEGLVIYYCNEQDQIIHIHKYKNKQYTILRTIRELFNSFQPSIKLQNRLSHYHIPLTQQEISHYLAFFMWLQQNKQPKQPFKMDWYESFVSDVSNVGTNDTNDTLGDDTVVHNDKILIMFIGLPGTGKTVLGSNLAMALNKLGMFTQYIDQDLFLGNKKQMMKTFYEYIQDPKVKYIINGRTNCSQDSRSQFTFESLKTVYIYLEADTNDEEILSVLIQRIQSREYHATLHKNENVTKIRNVIKKFDKMMEPPSTSSKNVIHINIGASLSIEKKFEQIQDTLELPITFTPFLWCRFIGLKVSPQDLIQCMSGININAIIPKVQAEFHVTLCHYTEFAQNYQYALYLHSLMMNHTKMYTIRIKSFRAQVDDENRIQISAFFVELPSELELHNTSRYPHITYAKQANVQALESNTLYGSYNFLHSFEEEINIQVELCRY